MFEEMKYNRIDGGNAMGELVAYGKEVRSVFELIGTLENDITKSIAWALSRCPLFTKGIIEELFNIDIDPDNVRIKYQGYEKGKGITDLEITDDDQFYVIIEAKRGWILPGIDQLTMYSQRQDITKSAASYKAIVSMSECSSEYAEMYLPFKSVNGIGVKHLSWRRIYEIAELSKVGSSNAQKNLLNELKVYLKGVMSMQEKDSNWVYVVSLGQGKPDNCNLTWIEIVKKNNKYFHPVGGKGGGGWPKEPVNYIAFRYNGKLQSIHYVEDYVVTKNLHDEVPEMPNVISDEDHFVYILGPEIKPMKEVKTGNIFPSGRKWAMLDTLLTSDTIYDACEISKARME